MGLDLYIEARIKEKSTGKIISCHPDIDFNYDENDEDKGYFEVCYWRGWRFEDVREQIIAIANRHVGTNYTETDCRIPLPQSALHEIYVYLLIRSCPSKNERFRDFYSTEWMERFRYEKFNLDNAAQLHNLLRTLSFIQYEDHITPINKLTLIDEKYIPDQYHLKQFTENPWAYEWEFRFFNSY